MKLVGRFNLIIVKPLEEDEAEKKGNIIVSDMGKEIGIRGIIVSVGPGMMSVTGDNFIPTTLKVGEKVILPPLGPVKVTFDGEEYYSCPETIITGVIEND